MTTKFTPEFIAEQREKVNTVVNLRKNMKYYPDVSPMEMKEIIKNYPDALDEIETLQKRMIRLIAFKKLLREKLQETKSNWFYWMDSDFVWEERLKTLIKDMNELAKKGNMADIQNYLNTNYEELVNVGEEQWEN